MSSQLGSVCRLQFERLNSMTSVYVVNSFLISIGNRGRILAL